MQLLKCLVGLFLVHGGRLDILVISFLQGSRIEDIYTFLLHHQILNGYYVCSELGVAQDLIVQFLHVVSDIKSKSIFAIFISVYQF